MAATVGVSRSITSDPLRSFKFNLYIPLTTQSDGITGGIARFGFMSVSGLGVSIEPLTYREGGDNLTTRKMPGQADINPITCSRGLFPTDYDNWYWMTNLFTAMYGGQAGVNLLNPDTLTPAPDFRTTMYINVLQHPNNTAAAPGPNAPYESSYVNQASIVQISFKLYSAWIGSLAYSDMDAGGNAVAVEQMTINYEGFDMQWGGMPGNVNGYVTNPVGW
jgi:phage tail-like protein